MILLLNTFVYVVVTYIIWRRTEKQISMPLVLWLTYSLFHVLACFLVQEADVVYRLFSIVSVRLDTPLKVDGLIYMFLCLIVLSIPIFMFRDEKIKGIAPPSPNRWKLFLYGYLFLAFFSIIGTFSHLMNVLSTGLDFDEMKDAAFNAELVEMSTYQIYIFKIVDGLTSTALIAMFYSLYDNKISRKIVVFLFCASFFPSFFMAIASASRARLFFLFVNYILGIILFRNLITEKIKRRLYLVFSISFVVFVVFISAITTSRFGDNTEAYYSLLLYFGQPFLNFNQVIYGGIDANSFMNGEMTFEYFHYFVNGMDRTAVVDSVATWNNKLGFSSNLFYTAIGNLYMDFGDIVTILICCFLAFCGYRILKNAGNVVPFHILIFYFSYFHICFQGIFDFIYGRYDGNITLIIVLVSYFFFRSGYTKQREKFLH